MIGGRAMSDPKPRDKAEEEKQYFRRALNDIVHGKKKSHRGKREKRTKLTLAHVTKDGNKSKEIPVDKQSIIHSPKEVERQRNKLRLWPTWLRGWKLVLEVATILGVLIASYTLRPILSSSAVDMSPGDTAVFVAMTNIGYSPIGSVSARCVTNKVIFDNQFTLELHKFYSWEAYSVNGLDSGESFLVMCPYTWSMLTSATDGFFAFGDTDPDRTGALGSELRMALPSPIKIQILLGSSNLIELDTRPTLRPASTPALFFSTNGP